jgi:hypothetical protein
LFCANPQIVLQNPIAPCGPLMHHAFFYVLPFLIASLTSGQVPMGVSLLLDEMNISLVGVSGMSKPSSSFSLFETSDLVEVRLAVQAAE